MDFTTHKIKITVPNYCRYYVINLNINKYAWLTEDGQVSTLTTYNSVKEVVQLFERTFHGNIHIERYEVLG